MEKTMRIYKKEDYIEDGIHLGLFQVTEKVPMEKHMHEFAEIIYIAQGEAIQTINDQTYQVRRGDMLFVNYKSTHSFSTEGGFTYINLCVSPEVLATRIIHHENAFELLTLSAFEDLTNGDGGSVIHFSGNEMHTVECILNDMLSENSATLPDRSVVMKSYLEILLTKLIRKLYPSKASSEKNDKLWKNLLDFIHQNLDKRLSLSDLAKKCFYNPSYFSRVFKERFGITLADYLTKERTEYATRLLMETDFTTEHIATVCGYGDKSSLYRAFRKEYGVTPSEYRSANKK
jgi:AraC-like DNA-binding protein/mannose-6-phosphate isomerase-like protein (cupin superfamily)